jgi:parallel beta-helix repeat protein
MSAGTLRKTLRTTLTLCAALLLLFSMLLPIRVVKGDGADNRIFIQPDGSVTPEGAPILIEGNTYTLTGNIYTSIVIEKSGVTLDGGGHILQGTFNGTMADLWMIGSGPQIAATNGPKVPWTIGIDLSDSSVANLTIKNIKVENFSIGMYIWTQNNTVKDDTIKGNIVGILIADSQNSFTGNLVENNTDGFFVGIGNPANPYSNIAVRDNYFINNTLQIGGCNCTASKNETNPWGINLDGNYWSDYNGTDKNGDGIGDVPYLVNGTIPDNHPLMHIPSTQLTQTPKNTNIELLLVVSLPIIVIIIAFIALIKRKKQASKPEKNSSATL